MDVGKVDEMNIINSNISANYAALVATFPVLPYKVIECQKLTLFGHCRRTVRQRHRYASHRPGLTARVS